jgi:hypothetical protein
MALFVFEKCTNRSQSRTLKRVKVVMKCLLDGTELILPINSKKQIVELF